MSGELQLVCMSDTHGLHRDVRAPEGDVLIHAGDCLRYGSRDDLRDFLAWFGAQPHRWKVLVAGNHDAAFEKHASECEMMVRDAGAYYLQDTGLDIHGVLFWGSPWTPRFGNWSFMLPRMGGELLAKWASIPEKTDVLITHGPPFGVQDLAPIGGHVGCELLEARMQASRPQLHVFGHIHEGYGIRAGLGVRTVRVGVGRDAIYPDLALAGNLVQVEREHQRATLYVNASVCDERYRPVNRPIVVGVSRRS